MEEQHTVSMEYLRFPATQKRNANQKTEHTLIPNPFWESHIHPRDRKRVLSSLKNVIEQFGRKWEDEYRFKTPDGNYALIHDSRWITYDYSLRPLNMKGTVEEITGTKLLQIFKQSLHPAMCSFSPADIRNVRNPIASICLAAELLATGKLNEEQKECINIINRNVKRINNFISEALVLICNSTD